MVSIFTFAIHYCLKNVAGFERNISPCARDTKKNLRAEIPYCLSARRAEDHVCIVKMSSCGRTNCYVFGIIGKLFENVREW